MFSKRLSPGEPLQSRWSPAAPEDLEDTLWFSLETLCLLLLQFPSTEISLWINTYTCRAYFYSQSILLLQDTLRIFCAYCLAVLCHLNTLRIISRTYRVSAHPQMIHVLHKVFEIPFDLPKIQSSLLLLACITNNPISLVILLASLVIIILSLLIQYVANARNPQ